MSGFWVCPLMHFHLIESMIMIQNVMMKYMERLTEFMN